MRLFCSHDYAVILHKPMSAPPLAWHEDDAMSNAGKGCLVVWRCPKCGKTKSAYLTGPQHGPGFAHFATEYEFAQHAK